jgi:hypothetical protein
MAQARVRAPGKSHDARHEAIADQIAALVRAKLTDGGRSGL